MTQTMPLVRAIARHWQVITSALLCAASVGVARGTFSAIQDRVTWIEQSHPDATAALTERNAADVAALRLALERVRDDTSATRVDVARLCERFGLPATLARKSGGYILIEMHRKNSARGTAYALAGR